MRSNNRAILLSLLVMALWGSLFPFVKIGYKVFNIDSSNVGQILMFAGVRFALSGFVVSFIAFLRKEQFQKKKGKAAGSILLVGLFSIVLHYSFTYIGLASTDSAKTALIKQLGTLLYVCFAFLFIKEEKFSVLKIVGALTGFVGIIAININSVGVHFSIGDLLIVLASVCTVTASILSKRVVADTSPFWVTGISQGAGGVVLMLAAYTMGADMLSFHAKSLAVFVYICTASTVAYVLWNYILRTTSLSKLFIIKFAEPMFACIFGAILLGEDIFKPQYLVAFLLISLGILMGNRSEKE